MPAEFRDINESGFLSFQAIRAAREDEADIEEEGPAGEPEEEPLEVRLSDPEFVEPDEGFQPNNPCQIRVKAELLRESLRKRVLFDVFSAYKDREVREYSGLEGFIRDGYAVAEMK